MARKVPGFPSTCTACRQPIVFARTLASPTGTGGKNQPLNPREDTTGRIAVRATGPHRSVARTLTGDETPDSFTEVLAMPHAATCAPTIPGTPTPLPPGVTDLATRRRR